MNLPERLTKLEDMIRRIIDNAEPDEWMGYTQLISTKLLDEAEKLLNEQT